MRKNWGGEEQQGSAERSKTGGREEQHKRTKEHRQENSPKHEQIYIKRQKEPRLKGFDLKYSAFPQQTREEEVLTRTLPL